MPVPRAVMLVLPLIVPLLVNSMPTAMVPEVTAVTVSVVVLMEPVNTAVAESQVCERSSTGALAVSVPLLAVSVVNAAEFGVVEPMAGGAAKSEVKAMVPEASGAVSVRVVPVVMPESWNCRLRVLSALS